MQHNAILLPSFHLIDTKIGLKYLNGNHELYIKILTNFLTRYKELEFLSLDPEASHNVVHAIKGLAATLGMQRLAEVASLLHNGEDHYRCHFDQELKRILQELNRGLGASVEVEDNLKTLLILNRNTLDIDYLLETLEGEYDVLVALELDEAIEILEDETIDLLLVGMEHKNEGSLIKLDELFQEKIPKLLIMSGDQCSSSDAIVLSSDREGVLQKVKELL